MKKIYFNFATTERRAAIVENGQVAELMIERPVENRLVGNIYKGRVVNVLPGMQAAFVDIGRDKNGFLYRDDILAFQQLDVPEQEKKQKSISEFIKQGEEVLVQVTKEPFGTKGPRLTGVVSFPGKYIVYMPKGGYVGVSRKINLEEDRIRLKQMSEALLKENEGMIVRTICEDIPAEKVKQELELLRGFWLEILEKGRDLKPPVLIHQDIGLLDRMIRDIAADDISEIVIDHFADYKRLQELVKNSPTWIEKIHFYNGAENLFSAYGIEKDLEKALKRQVWLKNGAYLMIDQTEALTIIDVNTGKFTGRNNLKDTIKKTNMEAAKEIAKQLRLRDISGMIIIDFIDMKEQADKEDVLRALHKAFEADRTKTNIVGITGLGLVEMTRKKIRQNLRDSLSKTCPTCLGKGVVLSNEAQASRIERTLWEYRMMEEEALVLELPTFVANVIKGEKGENLKKWEEKLQFRLYLFENEKMGEHEFAIRFIGTKKEAQERVKNLLRNVDR